MAYVGVGAGGCPRHWTVYIMAASVAAVHAADYDRLVRVLVHEAAQAGMDNCYYVPADEAHRAALRSGDAVVAEAAAPAEIVMTIRAAPTPMEQYMQRKRKEEHERRGRLACTRPVGSD